MVQSKELRKTGRTSLVAAAPSSLRIAPEATVSATAGVKRHVCPIRAIVSRSRIFMLVGLSLSPLASDFVDISKKFDEFLGPVAD